MDSADVPGLACVPAEMPAELRLCIRAAAVRAAGLYAAGFELRFDVRMGEGLRIGLLQRGTPRKVRSISADEAVEIALGALAPDVLESHHA